MPPIPGRAALDGRSVAVIGGGPGGTLAAAAVAAAGAKVTVFERMDAPEEHTGPRPPAWSINIDGTGQEAIKAAHLNSDFGEHWRLDGISLQSGGSKPKFFGPWLTPPKQASQDGQGKGKAKADATAETPPSYLLSQPGIAEHLRQEVKRVYGGSVVIEYGASLVGGRVTEGEVEVQLKGGAPVKRQFDLVIGADGAFSATWKLLQEQDPDFRVEIAQSSLSLLCAYVTPQGPPSNYANLETPSGQPFQGTPPGQPRDLTGCTFNYVTAVASGKAQTAALHAKQPAQTGSSAKASDEASAVEGEAGDVTPAPPSLKAAVVNTRHNGAEVTVLLSGSEAWLTAHSSESSAFHHLCAALPSVPTTWLKEVASALVAAGNATGPKADRTIRTFSFITCSKLGSGRAVLIGDAAHALSANLGMGCNAALADSQELMQSLSAVNGNLDLLSQRFTADRGPYAKALVMFSQSIDTVINVRYNRDYFMALRSLPVWLLSGAASLPGPGFLKTDVKSLLHKDNLPHLKRNALVYLGKLVAVLLGAVAAARIAVWGGGVAASKLRDMMKA